MSESPYKIRRTDPAAQIKLIRDELQRAFDAVLDSGAFVLGRHLSEFEKAFAAYTGAAHAVGVSCGTEALYLALRATNVGEGDEVITSPFTFVGTVSAIRMCKANPVFVDIHPETFNIDPSLIDRCITKQTKAIMPVHLYGRIAQMSEILGIAKARRLPVIEDAAQAHGSLHHGKRAGSFGCLSCFSFYPSKNLGAFGDAGAITADDEGLSERLRLLRNYGQQSPYRQEVEGINSRLDDLQAAFLSVKLKYLDTWNESRRRLAARYAEILPKEHCTVPQEAPYEKLNHHVYVVRARRRDELMAYLGECGIQTNVYYPVPAHLQSPNKSLGYREGDFPVAEQASREVLALPMYPEMPISDIDMVADAIRKFYTGGRS